MNTTKIGSVSVATNVDGRGLYERQGVLALLSLNQPECANVQNENLLCKLDVAFVRAVNDDDIGAIVLRGEGAIFPPGTIKGRLIDRPGAVTSTASRLGTKVAIVHLPVCDAPVGASSA